MSRSKTPIEKCEFSFQCPKTWEALLETNIESIRYCHACERNVFLSESVEDAVSNARKGRCVAIPVELTDESRVRARQGFTVGVLERPDYH